MSAALQQKPQVQVKLSVVKGPHAGQSFSLSKEKIVIGRGPENDVVLMNDPLVSRLHAQIILVDRDFEIQRISQKNAVLVEGENIDKWKLVNGSVFVIGDSELKIEYNLGQAVASVPPRKLASVLPLKLRVGEETVVGNSSDQVPAVKLQPKANAQPVVPQQQQQQPVRQPAPSQLQRSPLLPNQQRPGPVLPRNPQGQSQPGPARPAATPAQTSIFDNPKFRFYAVAGIIIAGLVFYVLSPQRASKAAKLKPTLKYEDEISIKLNSTPEKELVQRREDKKIDRNSPQHLRAEENFIKGMRDYQLGNYARSMEFFQVVLNLESDHALAKRHLYLSKVRFDELVQTKLMLGESYFNKHNFNMCALMYQQVMNMLIDRKADSKYKLAERKNNECELASEGIR
jgi:hypothetical protein